MEVERPITRDMVDLDLGADLPLDCGADALNRRVQPCLDRSPVVYIDDLLRRNESAGSKHFSAPGRVPAAEKRPYYIDAKR